MKSLKLLYFTCKVIYYVYMTLEVPLPLRFRSIIAHSTGGGKKKDDVGLSNYTSSQNSSYIANFT